MPKFKVTAPDGRHLSIEGDAPPSEAELDDIFKNMPPATQQQSAQPPSMSMPSLSTQDMAAGAAGVAGAVGANAVPAVNAAARYVAGSPVAQRVIGSGIGAATGAMTGVGDLAVDALIGGTMKDAVGKVASKVASATQGVKATVGRNPQTGQFTKLMPSAFKEVMGKLGSAMSMTSGESAVLSSLNDPAKVKAFIAKLSPEEKAKLFRQMPASFAKEYQD